MENWKKHNRRHGFTKYDDFQIYADDKKIIDLYADVSTNLSNAISPIDSVMLNELHKIIQEIKIFGQKEKDKNIENKKNLRNMVLARLSPTKNVESVGNKKVKNLSGNFKIILKSSKSEKKIGKGGEKNTESRKNKLSDGKVKKSIIVKHKKYKIKSMNLPIVTSKTRKQPSSSIEFKSNFLV